MNSCFGLRQAIHNLHANTFVQFLNTPIYITLSRHFAYITHYICLQTEVLSFHSSVFVLYHTRKKNVPATTQFKRRVSYLSVSTWILLWTSAALCENTWVPSQPPIHELHSLAVLPIAVALGHGKNHGRTQIHGDTQFSFLAVTDLLFFMITVTTQNPFSLVSPSKCHLHILNQWRSIPLHHLSFAILLQTIQPLDTMQY
jgi:hypothetical protein